MWRPGRSGAYTWYPPSSWGSKTNTENAREALGLYVEGLREEGRPLDTGVVRRKLPLPA
jgi:hypothetical protein